MSSFLRTMGFNIPGRDFRVHQGDISGRHVVQVRRSLARTEKDSRWKLIQNLALEFHRRQSGVDFMGYPVIQWLVPWLWYWW